MARHAAPDTLPRHLHAAHYLTPSTQDYPLVMLLSSESDGGNHGHLPWTAYGVLPLTSASAAAWGKSVVCESCGGAAHAVVEDGGEIPADATGSCWDCLLQGDHGGVIPTCYVELIGV